MKQPFLTRSTITTFVDLAIVGFFLAVILTPIFMPAQAASTRSNCLSSLKTLGRQANLYTSDHDFFMDPTRWNDLLVPEYETSVTLTCLRSSGIDYSYAMNRELSGKRWSTLPAPETQLLFFDSKVMTPNASGDASLLPDPPRHSGMNNGVFADGHARTLRSRSPGGE